MDKTKDYFAQKADGYDLIQRRTTTVKNLSEAILKNVEYKKDMSIMDFGSGTGLLSLHIAPYVERITAIDISKSMNDVLREKADSFPCEIEILEVDLSKTSIDKKFDGIISSMSIHHIYDIKNLMKKFHIMLEDGGSIAICDLDSEDGSFHSVDTGVFHNGFDREELLRIVENVGFKNAKIELATTINKPHRDFDVFVLTAYK